MGEESTATDVLVFVEDPGAANYVADLPDALAAVGRTCSILTRGVASTYLAERGREREIVPDSVSAPSLLRRFSPGLVLVGTSENPDTLGFSLVDAARSVGIQTVGLVDGFANADHRFRGRGDHALSHAPDWVGVPDVWTRDAFVELGVPPARIAILGHPQYDRARATGRALARFGRESVRRRVVPLADDGRAVVVFAAEVSDGLDADQFRKSADYTLHGRGESTRRTEVVLEELLDAIASLEPRPYLVLRLHPKNTTDEFASYLGEVDEVSSGGDPLELVFAADLVVGMTSLLLLEAALLGRATLSVIPRPQEREWLPTTRSRTTPCATTRAELRGLLPAVLAPTGLESQADFDLLPADSVRRVRQFILDRLELTATGE